MTYFLAYIDRINVSFAGLTMRGDLDMSATAFGFALGTIGATSSSRCRAT
jgi:ACS family tartrate transporter-like MFS transporter